MNSIPIGPSTCPLFLLSIPVFLCFHLFVFFIILFVFVFWEGRGVNLLSSECFWLIFSDLGYFFQLFLKIFGIIYGWYRVCFGSSRLCFGNSRVCFGNSRVILDIFWTIFSDSGEKVAQLAGSFFSNPFFKIIRSFFEMLIFSTQLAGRLFFKIPEIPNSNFQKCWFSKVLIFSTQLGGGYMKKMSIWNFENMRVEQTEILKFINFEFWNSFFFWNYFLDFWEGKPVVFFEI